MATRADFYIRKNNKLELLGCTSNSYYGDFEEATNEKDFRKAVSELLKENKSIEGKWYWPWKTSFITDEVFVFDVRPRLFQKDRGVLLAKVQSDNERQEPILAFIDYNKRYEEPYVNDANEHYTEDCIFIEMPVIGT